MKVRVSAVFEKDSEILCMNYNYGGQEVFSLPGGGVDHDIPLHQVIAKEWMEELGIKIDVGDVLLIGEAPAVKHHPQTLHIVFEALQIHGTPKLQSENTTALGLAWIPVEKLSSVSLYPDVGKELYACLTQKPRRCLPYLSNCMKRGYW